MTAADPGTLYVELVKRSVAGLLTREQSVDVPAAPPANRALRAAHRLLTTGGARVVRRQPIERVALETGHGWPATYPAHVDTMIGLKRLDNLVECVEQALADDVPGDLIETGVWRGGATILMRAILAARGETGRKVVVADSFRGLPPPNVADYPQDAGLDLSGEEQLAIPLEQVRDNFARYGLLDEQVEFVEGWFKDTLPRLADRTWAVIRLDGDLYESTMDALSALYPRLSPGGFVIVDDYGAYRSCREAVHDFRDKNGITGVIRHVDWTGAYWRREN